MAAILGQGGCHLGRSKDPGNEVGQKHLVSADL